MITRALLLQEFRPYERSGQERSQVLLWTPDGQYVHVGVRDGWSSSHVVCVFNATTGKHRASFNECHGINGVILLLDASQLVVGGEDGKIRFWDFQAAMKVSGNSKLPWTTLPSVGLNVSGFRSLRGVKHRK